MDGTEYRVDVIGNIWQPGVGPCAGECTVREPMEYPRAAGESDRDYEVRMVQCAADHLLGDFRQILGWSIVRVDQTYRTNDDGSRTLTRTYTDLVEFSTDALDAYDDALV
jgi:hypothetical protein